MITLTTFDLDDLVREALSAGASGFLLKDVTPEHLVGAVRLGNTELAARLHLSETTVRTHVSRILGKLQLRDQVQAVVLAYGSGLVAVGR